MTPRDKSDSGQGFTLAEVARVRLTFDGIVVLAEESMTLSAVAKALCGSWWWNIPFGLGGTPHFIGVHVEFR